MGLEVPLDPGLEGHGTRGAADAGAVEADLDDALGRDVYEFEVAAVGLNGGTYQSEDPVDLLAEVARWALDGRFHT